MTTEYLKFCQAGSVSNFLAGCLNSYGEHSILIFDGSCIENCVEKVTIWNSNAFSNKECALNWTISSFLVDNQYWKPTKKFENDFALFYNNTAMPQALHVKVFKC